MITIVSGLPRSGTSLMMQMLSAGGFPVLSDALRQPDEDNPRGYFEWERIKLLPHQPDCIREADGKVVKVVTQLLFALPGNHNYRLIFMERPLEEVVASQAQMIQRRGTQGPAVTPDAMIAGFRLHLNLVNVWLNTATNISLLRVKYHDVLREPLRISEALRQFVERELDLTAMQEQVDLSLYRQRRAQIHY